MIRLFAKAHIQVAVLFYKLAWLLLTFPAFKCKASIVVGYHRGRIHENGLLEGGKSFFISMKFIKNVPLAIISMSLAGNYSMGSNFRGYERFIVTFYLGRSLGHMCIEVLDYYANSSCYIIQCTIQVEPIRALDWLSICWKRL